MESIELLKELRNVIEHLATFSPLDIWDSYGGLRRLTTVLEKILSHELRDDAKCYSRFLLGLYWLKPELIPMELRCSCNKLVKVPGRTKPGFGSQWIQCSLKELSFGSQISFLLESRNHLESWYKQNAFLRNPRFTKSLLICLRAIETNNFVLLALLDPLLINYDHSSRRFSSSAPQPSLSNSKLLNKSCSSAFDLFTLHDSSVLPKRRHSINSSFPSSLKLRSSNSYSKSCLNISASSIDQSLAYSFDPKHYNDLDESIGNISATNGKSLEEGLAFNKVEQLDKNVDILDKSSPGNDLSTGLDALCLSTEVPSSPKKQQTNKKGHTRSHSDIGVQHSTNRSEASYNFPLSMPSCGSSFSNFATGDPKPADFHQSLSSYITSTNFDFYTDLDKENAHFFISEAVIAAIEQAKCNESLLRLEKEQEGESDEEIQDLKQKIRIRVRQRKQEKARLNNLTLLSDGKTDSSPTSQSTSPVPMSSSPSEGSQTSDDIDDLEDLSDSKLDSLKKSGLSLSMASLYTESDIVKQAPSSNQELDQSLPPSTLEMSYSADSVALTLLRKFSEKQLPKASELEWLVTEQDVPQRLLPLPNSWPIGPDAVEEDLDLNQICLRGNFEWAPPRPQIIFNIHPTQQKKVVVAKQNYRCAGCGMKVDRKFVSKLRFCNYLGRYFCQCCHSNQLAVIPARIIRKWDFDRYSVSRFSADLLNKIFTDPIFNLTDINPSLFRRIKVLDQVRDLRLRLYHLREYILRCKQARPVQEKLQKFPDFLFLEPHSYSLEVFHQVKKGDLKESLEWLVSICITHIHVCPLCKAQGYFCERCHTEEVIFPFQTSHVIQCQGCRGCYHKECYKTDDCVKCARILERRKKLEENCSSSSL